MRAVADDAVRQPPRQIDAHAEPVVERPTRSERDRPVVVVVEQRRPSGTARAAPSSREWCRPPSSRSWLSEAPAWTRIGKRLRRDLQVERPAIAGARSRRSAACASVMTRVKMSSRPVVLLGFERPRTSSGSASDSSSGTRYTEPRCSVAPVARQRDAVDDEIALVEASLAQPALHRLAERQEARAQLVGERSQTEVEARRLELLVAQRCGRGDPPRLDRRAQGHIRQDAGAGPAVRRGVSLAHAAHLASAPHRRSRHRPPPSTGSPRPRCPRRGAAAPRARRAPAPSPSRARPARRHRPRRRAATARRRESTQPRAPAPRAAASPRRHPRKQSQTVGLMQPVVERGVEHVEAAGLQRRPAAGRRAAR